MAVIGMSLLLIVGFITVIARIIYLTSRPATPVAAATTAGTPIKPEALLDLPANGSVKSLSLSGNRLAVHYVSPLGDGIAILDLEQGRDDISPRRDRKALTARGSPRLEVKAMSA